MKLAAASMIKDEADVIESFIRVNSGWADHFFILDNGSSDNTPHILRRLAEEGYGITVTRDGDIYHRQDRKMTKLVREAAAGQAFDFIFPIDGDEFIADAGGLKRALQGVGPDAVGALEWSTLVPNDNTAMSRPAPLHDGFSRRKTELRGIRKIVIPGALARAVDIQMGNHNATAADGSPVAEKLLDVPLFHAPVRSKEQIIAKAIIGSRKMTIKEGRKKDEGFHWTRMAAFIASNGFDLSDEQFREIALSYGWSAGDPKVREVEPVSICPGDQVMKYSELGKVNVAQLLDGFIGQLCDELVASRSSAPMIRKLLRKAVRSLV